MNEIETIQLYTPNDALLDLRQWVRRERQRAELTQSELAKKSGVPSASISRLELTGLSSTDSLFKVLFALERLDAFQSFIAERQRLAAFPLHLDEESPRRDIQRVRHRKDAS